MKKLIMINGTMGVGKTSVSTELLKMLTPGVYLDGDWCWYMHPFEVTEETKKMVLDNITYLLRNFLSCSQYSYVIFSWVMHEESILDWIVDGLTGLEFELHKFSLVCTESALTERLQKDIAFGRREGDIIERSVARLPLYRQMNTIKIDVSSISAVEAAEMIKEAVEK